MKIIRCSSALLGLLAMSGISSCTSKDYRGETLETVLAERPSKACDNRQLLARMAPRVAYIFDEETADRAQERTLTQNARPLSPADIEFHDIEVIRRQTGDRQVGCFAMVSIKGDRARPARPISYKANAFHHTAVTEFELDRDKRNFSMSDFMMTGQN